MKAVWILGAVMVFGGCGVADSSSGSGQNIDDTIGGLQGTPIAITSAIIPPNAATRVPPPTINPDPIVDGDHVLLNIDAHWLTVSDPITITQAQVLQIFQPANQRDYVVEFDEHYLHLDSSSTLDHPTDTGWIWHPQTIGQTVITIRERKRPCTQAGCPGGPPPRWVEIPLLITP